MIDMLAKLIEQNIQHAPFFTMVAGKPKMNTAKLLEVSLPMSLVLGLLWTQIGDVKTAQHKMAETQHEIIVVQKEQQLRLENITSVVMAIDDELDEIKDIVYKPIHGD